MNLDNHIQGDYDPNNPFNQPDSEEVNLCITDLIYDGMYEDAAEKLCDLRIELQKLRDTAKLIQNSYLKNMLNSIIQKI